MKTTGQKGADAIFALPLILYKRLLSPFLPPSCRFYPTCSTYAIDALNAHGPIKGAYLSLRRLLRCHPFNEGGYDPVIKNGHDRGLRHDDV